MNITQRNASLSDWQLILNWRNSVDARKFSVNPKILSKDEHMDWLASRLERIRTDPFLLFFENGTEVGFSRFDFVQDSNNIFEISIVVDSKVQGIGLGTRILQDSCKFFFDLHLDGIVRARVHKMNIASQRIFTKTGFLETSCEGEFLLYELKSTVNQKESL